MVGFQKYGKGIFLSLLALLLTAGVRVVPAAAETNTDTVLSDGGSITVDYEKELMYVTVTSTQEVMVCTPTVSSSTKDGIKKITEKTYDIYLASEDNSYTCTVDLSTLSKKKTSYLMVKSSESEEPILVQFNPGTQSLKSVYSATDGTVSLYYKSGKTKVYLDADCIEYRTSLGTWQDYAAGTQEVTTETTTTTVDGNDTDTKTETETTNGAVDALELYPYQQNGATLYLREKGGIRTTTTGDTTTETSAEETTEDDGVTTKVETKTTTVPTTATYAVQEKFTSDNVTEITASKTELSYAMVACTGQFNGSEIKIKITKLATGPSATMDYSNKTAKIAKNLQYRFGMDSDWSDKLTSATKVNLDAENSLLEVRTAATSSKAASKITRYEYSFQDAPTVGSPKDNSFDTTTGPTESTNIVTDYEGGIVAYSGVDVVSVTEMTTYIAFVNTSKTSSYEIVYTASTSGALIADDDDADTLEEALENLTPKSLAAVSGSTTAKYLKLYKSSNKGKTYYFYIRVTADKTTGACTSDYTYIGSYTFDSE